MPPTGFQDRVAERRRTLDELHAGEHPFLLLVGAPGNGKTAILAKLAEALRGPDGAGVDWFAYLPAFGQLEVSPTTILNALARMVDSDDADGVSQRLLRDREVSWQQAADAILDRLGARRVVLALDNAELLADRTGRLADTELSRLLHRISVGGHEIIFVLASSRPIDLRPIPNRKVALIPIDPGLGPDDGAELLRSMDPDGVRGLGSATTAERKRLSRLANGHPRTLELVVALLSCDGRATVPRLISGLELDCGDAPPATYLMKRILEVLPELDRSVLTALAILSEPAPAVAVDYVLAPYLGNLDAASTLELLRSRFVIRAYGDRFHIPSPEDAALVLSGVPVGQPAGEYSEIPQWSRTNLARMAAEYYREVAMPNAARVDDLAPQFSEVDQLIRAGDPVGAAKAVEELNERYLRGWGQTHLAMPWLRRLLDQLAAPQQRIPVVSMMVNGHHELGEHLEAQKLIKEVEPIVSALPPDRVVQFYIQAGTTGYYHGQVDAPAQLYRSALVRTGPDDWAEAVKARSGLACCALRAGDLATAQGQFAAARDVLANRSGDTLGLAGELDLNEATLHQSQGDYAGAEELWKSARRVSRDRKHRNENLEALTYCAEASLMIDRGDFGAAAETAEQAITLASSRRDIRILRQAKNEIALAYLCDDKLEPALREARFAASIVQRHGALHAYTLYGLAQLRLEDDNAGTTLDKARALAEDHLGIDRNNFRVWDLLGVVLLAKYVGDTLAYEERAIAAFQKARAMTSAPGVVSRVQLLIDQVAKAAGTPPPELFRAAASGAVQ